MALELSKVSQISFACFLSINYFPATLFNKYLLKKNAVWTLDGCSSVAVWTSFLIYTTNKLKLLIDYIVISEETLSHRILLFMGGLNFGWSWKCKKYNAVQKTSTVLWSLNLNVNQFTCQCFRYCCVLLGYRHWAMHRYIGLLYCFSTARNEEYGTV